MLRDFFRMLRHGRNYWRYYLVGTIALAFVDVLDTLTPKIVQWFIDDVKGIADGAPAAGPLPDGWFAPDSILSGMWVYGALYVSIVALAGLFRYFMSMSYAGAGVRFIHDLRGRYFSHLQRLDAAYHDRSKVGDHMSRATNDTEACRMFFGIGLLLLLDTAFYFVLVPVYMATINVKLMLASLVTLPLIPIIVARLTQTVESRFEEMQEQFSTLSERARESFSGAKVVKSFAREDAEIRSFAKLSAEYVRRGLRFARVIALEHPLLMLILGLADLIVVVYGGSLALAGEITVGEFTAFFMYLIRLSGPMMGLGWVVTLYQRARVSMGRIQEVLEVEPAIREPDDPEPVNELRGEVEIRDLTFSYGSDAEPALVGISVHVAAGATLGIVGEVGSGKSTLLNLIPRLYDPPPGTVLLDGIDVRRIPLPVLRTRIGAVPQETYLFGETIRENIALGCAPSALPEGRVERCARLARIAGEITALPNGYETLLGEKGVNLSGGQKQRVAIARALARAPAVLLLDDCLSSVDTATETAILENLRRETRDRTAIVVSHRVSTVQHADEILVLVRGRIAERGTHETLIPLGGYYADLEERQSGGEER